jgi:hypothetical protein
MCFFGHRLKLYWMQSACLGIGMEVNMDDGMDVLAWHRGDMGGFSL